VDTSTKALNLWDIEQRINQIQHELEMLHEAKDDLLSDDYVHKEYTRQNQINDCQ